MGVGYETYERADVDVVTDRGIRPDVCVSINEDTIPDRDRAQHLRTAVYPDALSDTDWSLLVVHQLHTTVDVAVSPDRQTG